MTVAQARLLIDLKRWEEARTALGDSLADPNSGAEPWFLLARIQLGLAQPTKCRDAARRGLAIWPDSEWGLRLLSIAELQLGDKKAAQRAAEHAVALSPEQPETLYALTNVYLARGNRKQAEALVERNLAANPDSSLARESAAAVALSRRRWPDAERHARAGLALDPQDGDLMLQLGTALQAQGKRTEAAEVYAASARANPRDHRGRRALGRLGMTVAGGGFLGLKLLPVIILTVNNESWLATSGRGHALIVAVIVAVVLALVYGIQEFRQHRAVAQLSPSLRAAAGRERRSVQRFWLRLTAALAILLSLLALIDREFGTAAVLLVIAAGTWFCGHRWFPAPKRVTRSNRTRLSRALHSIRWRFR